tara:strand:+ start:1057 stop:2016 length:960 start_codon:yes stop_codon:yes gene_type:complete
MKWGILGSGLRAHEIAQQIISNGHELTSVASRDEEHALVMAKAFSEDTTVENYEQLISRDDLDAVYIANETSAHFEILMQALERNHKVFCANPLCFNLSQYQQLMQSNGFLVQDLWTDWHPLITKLVAILKQNRLGKLEFMRANFNCYLNPGYQNWRLKSHSSGGGVFWDLMIYLISIALKIHHGKIVSCNTDFQMDENNSPMMFDLLLEFEDSSKAHLTVSGLLDRSQPLIAFCSRGKVSLGGSTLDPVKLVIEPFDSSSQVIERKSENPTRFSYLSFMRLLNSEPEYKLHRLDTDHLMHAMFQIQDTVSSESSAHVS